MSADVFDLGLRMRAEKTRTVARRLVAAPVAPVCDVVAVSMERARSGVTFRVATPDAGTHSGSGADVLDALAAVGVSMAAQTTVVVDGLATVDVLAGLARKVDASSSLGDVAAHVGWWAERADFPGGHAVCDVLSACRQRWVCGTAPSAERAVETWSDWLGLPSAGNAAETLLGLHGRVSDGVALTHLDVLAEDHEYWWTRAQTGFAEGWDWTRPDTTSRAALGLRSRCDAADLYEDGLMQDPLFRLRGLHTGHVVVGVAARVAGDKLARVVVTSDRLDARLRAGTRVTGWVGAPQSSGPRFTGEVLSTRAAGSRLQITLTGVSRSMIGADPVAVTLHEAGPDPFGQRRSRGNLRGLYMTRRSWLTTGRTPTPTRRDVPLAVLVAGANADDKETT